MDISFFDGEQIYKFTEPGNEEKIKNAVRNILRIEEIGRGYKHLSDIASEYRRELKRNSTGNLNKLLDEREKQAISAGQTIHYYTRKRGGD